jgi:hypothetical protein
VAISREQATKIWAGAAFFFIGVGICAVYQLCMLPDDAPHTLWVTILIASGVLFFVCACVAGGVRYQRHNKPGDSTEGIIGLIAVVVVCLYSVLRIALEAIGIPW